MSSASEFTAPHVAPTRAYENTFIALSTCLPRRITVQGELDLVTAPQLRLLAESVLVDGSGPGVLDLTGLTFIDATGLGVIVEFARRLAARGAALLIRGVSARTRHVFALAGLDGLLA